jgi:hypothetical protein
MKRLAFKSKRISWTSVIAGLLGLFLAAWITEWLWDWKCVQIFGAPHIEYWDAFWLILLVRGVKGSGTLTLSNYVIEEDDSQ